jgi:AAA+ ATPase superfamily predicted ATPase
MKIIGRSREIDKLEHFCNRNQATFIAVYGRRRIGKTYLIREFFEPRAQIKMCVTGEKKAPVQIQLQHFQVELERSFYNGARISPLKNWRAAFEQLTAAIKLSLKDPSIKEVLIFLDELPWLATRRSGLCAALDHAWNTSLSLIPQLRLVICGSAASWIIENIIRDTGGLHNRLSASINLMPFTFAETKKYCAAKGIRFSSQELIEIFTCFGGVPFYLEHLQGEFSAAQNIDQLMFKDGELKDEYPALLAALYRNAKIHKAVIKALSTAPQGLTRDLIAKLAKTTLGGGLSEILEELEAAGFIKAFSSYGYTERGTIYRLNDEFLTFYFHWIKKQKKGRLAQPSWIALRDTPAYYAWAGYAFESLILKHYSELQKALGFADVSCEVAPWRAPLGKSAAEATSGCQIDLLYDRADGVITMCELKHTKEPIKITSELIAELNRKESIFRSYTKTKKRIQWAIVSNHKIPTHPKHQIKAVSTQEIFKD